MREVPSLSVESGSTMDAPICEEACECHYEDGEPVSTTEVVFNHGTGGDRAGKSAMFVGSLDHKHVALIYGYSFPCGFKLFSTTLGLGAAFGCHVGVCSTDEVLMSTCSVGTLPDVDVSDGEDSPVEGLCVARSFEVQVRVPRRGGRGSLCGCCNVPNFSKRPAAMVAVVVRDVVVVRV